MATSQPTDEPNPTDVDPGRSDADLIDATRAGDTGAYGALYERHVHAARRLGRVLAHDTAEADDLVSETFAKVLSTLRAGRGPELAFRAYLLTTLRNTFYDRTRRDKKVEFTDDMSRHDPGEAFVDTALDGQERRYAAQAFRRLPERWQVVLWHTEVEGESAAQVAPLLGLSPNGVAALAYRARERLRQMYLQAHIQDSPAATCRWTADRLGAKVRGGLASRDGTKVDEHLQECAACKLLFVELTEVNSGIRGVLAPLVLGAAAPAYLGGTAWKSIFAAGWLGGIADGARQAANWVRRGFQRLGPRGATATGAGVAVAAAALALILVANHTPDSPTTESQPPDDAAAPPEDSADDDSDTPAPDDDQDEEPDPEGSDESESESDSDPDSDDPADEDPLPEDSEYDIDVDPSTSTLAAGGAGVLPVQLQAPDAAPQTSQRAPLARVAPDLESADVRARESVDADDETTTLTLTLPDGVRGTGGDAGDGWTCEAGDAQAQCQRGPLEPGQSTTAYVPLSIDPHVTGFHDVEANVESADFSTDTVLRTPVAPPQTSVAFASLNATGVANAGNTLLTCKPQPHCGHDYADNHTSVMTAYTAGPNTPAPPAGEDEDVAVSGAQLTVPSGAEVLWAGLHWADSGSEPPAVRMAGPGSGWHSVDAQQRWSGTQRPVHQAAADVTGLVGGSGEYWVAADADAISSGPWQYGGWSLTVVYRQAGGPAKEAAVYEGLAEPRGDATVSVDIPHGGGVDVGYTLWDGDRTLTGDTLAVGGEVVANVGRGRSESALEGEDWNTLGVDVAVCRAETGAEPTHATIHAGNDPLEVGVLAVAAPSP